MSLREELESINSTEQWKRVQAKYDPEYAILGDRIDKEDNSHLARIAAWRSESNQEVEL